MRGSNRFTWIIYSFTVWDSLDRLNRQLLSLRLIILSLMQKYSIPLLFLSFFLCYTMQEWQVSTELHDTQDSPSIVVVRRTAVLPNDSLRCHSSQLLLCVARILSNRSDSTSVVYYPWNDGVGILILFIV